MELYGAHNKELLAEGYPDSRHVLLHLVTCQDLLTPFPVLQDVVYMDIHGARSKGKGLPSS